MSNNVEKDRVDEHPRNRNQQRHAITSVGRQWFLAFLALAVFVVASWVTLTPVLSGDADSAEQRAKVVQNADPVADGAQISETPQLEGGEVAASSGIFAIFRGWVKDSIRSYNEDIFVWSKESIRHYLRNLETSFLSLTAWLWMICFILLAQLVPAKPLGRLLTPNKLMDLIYPLLNSSFRWTILLFLYEPMRSFYDTHLPFLNTRLLDDLPLVTQGLLAFLIMDFAFWVSHWARHKIPWLWYFHSVHHSQKELSPQTVWRTHPLESTLISIFYMIPVSIFGGDQSAWLVVIVFSGAAWPYFIHSNVRVNLGFLNRFIVSPQYHRVHHSINREQHDRNFGEHIIFWDWLFGTIERDTNIYPETGIPEGEFIEEYSQNPISLFGMWLRHCAYPFLMIGRSTKTALKRVVSGG